MHGLSNQIVIMEIEGKDGFYLREELVRRFGTPGIESKILDVSLDILKTDLVITPSNEITRYRLVMTAKYILKHSNGKHLISEQKAIARTDYNSARNSTGYTAQVAEEAARKRLAIELADQISTRLLVLSEAPQR